MGHAQDDYDEEREQHACTEWIKGDSMRVQLRGGGRFVVMSLGLKAAGKLGVRQSAAAAVHRAYLKQQRLGSTRFL